MNASLSWIKAYVPDLDVSYKDFADAMTLSGTKVEGYKVFDEDIDNIVVGKILKIDKHPDADKLVVCKVDVGDEEIQIVTGATNVSEGALVPVVKVGGRVAGGHDGSVTPGGIKIKAGKLRGVESFGMLCSIEELGSSRDMYPEAPEDGIYIFGDDHDVKPGDDAIEALSLHDANYEFEVTSNRVDCYSVLGLAREAAATFRKSFKAPVPEVRNTVDDINDYLEIEIKDSRLCPRYTARMVKNLRIAPSPKWLQRRLSSSGIRPINNIVDITNYVMEEYGQPMHAFNYDAIGGKKIVVKTAEKDEVFVTLDGQERKLDDNVLMICDAERSIGIAGIMGGEESKITDDVKTLVFESATFDGTNNRLSSKRLGLRTDASGKFEKGLDPENTLAAIERACELVEMLDAGDVVGGIIDVYPERYQERKIKFDPVKINEYLGTDISKEQMLEYFKPLEIIYDEASEMLTPPSFRQDLLREADIAEEVARFYGYDNIPLTLPTNSGGGIGGLSKELSIDETIRSILISYGYSESMSFSFESPKVFDKLGLKEDDVLRNAVKISNPLGEDYSIMRTSLVDGMLNSLALNYNRRNKEAALFEISNIYLPKGIPLTELPDERMTLCIGSYGTGDFYYLKGVAEDLFSKLGVKEHRVYVNKETCPFLHPGRQAEIMIDDVAVGFIGELHPLIGKKYDISERVLLSQIDVQTLYEISDFKKKYTEIPKYPAVNRDISLLMDKGVAAGDIERTITEQGGKLLEKVDLFDVYEGDRIQEGCKSLAYTMSFRAKDKTLEDAEVNDIMDKIIKALQEKGIELRS